MLRLSTIHIGLAGRTFIGRASSTYTQSDRELQLNFNMIGSKFKKALQLLEKPERMKFIKLQEDKIIRNDNILMAVWMYVQLQNPLLERYSVDVPEIITGATYAFDCAYRAIYSKDINDYAVGERVSSVSNNLLKDTMSTLLYISCLCANKKMREKGVVYNITDLHINTTTLTNIYTEIVPDNVAAGVECIIEKDGDVYKLTPSQTSVPAASATVEGAPICSTKPATRAASRASCNHKRRRNQFTTTHPAPAETATASVTSNAAAPTSTVAHTNTQQPAQGQSHQTPVYIPSPLSAYPPGSVLACVEVRFDIQEELETRRTRRNSVRLTFRGCISGQVPLSWRIIGFNGGGYSNSEF